MRLDVTRVLDLDGTRLTALAAAPAHLAYPAAYPAALAIETLVAWLLTASLGAYMLSRWVVRGGLLRHRLTGEGLAPAVVFTHFGLAVSGLAVWIGYLATGWAPLAWSAVGVLMVVVGLGISTVTLLTPYPVRVPPSAASPGAAVPPAHQVTDELLSRALTDDVLSGQLVDDLLAQVSSGPARTPARPGMRAAALIPVGHGVGALSTFLLAVLTAVAAK